MDKEPTPGDLQRRIEELEALAAHKLWRHGRTTGLRILVLAACLAAALFAGGIAVASIPDAGGVLHGCVLNKVGMLRVIDASVTRCRANETPITWNQTGPRGLPGSNGISEAYATSGNNVSVVSADTHVAALTNLPAGKYIISASLAEAAPTQSMTCWLDNGSSFVGPDGLVSFSVPETLSASGSITLHCTETSGYLTSSTVLQYVTLTAVAVDTVHTNS